MLWRLRGTATATLMWLMREVNQESGTYWSADRERARLFTDSEKGVATQAGYTEGCTAIEGLTKWESAASPECNCEVCQRKIVSLSETGRS